MSTDQIAPGGELIVKNITPEVLREEAIKRGVLRVGMPEHRPDLEPNHLYVIYMDQYGNEYVIRRGILTIVSCYGRVY